MIQKCRRILRLAFTGATPVQAAWVALVVGTILVLINQWEVLLGMKAVSIPKLLLTYLVPYLVSTYTAVSKDMRNTSGEERGLEGQWPHE